MTNKNTVGTNGAALAVHVTPRSSRDEVVGIRMADDGSSEVSVRVTAPPDAGKANAAVCKLVAKQVGVPKSSVRVKRGEASRHKILEIDVDPGSVAVWLEGLKRL